MKHADYTELAKYYHNRGGYSERVLGILKAYVGGDRQGFLVADVGAGTGKLTEILADLGLRGYAIEPNDAMRGEGIGITGDRKNFAWSKGTAEATGLEDDSVDWVVMASAFHWTDAPSALREFHRVLKPGGFFTAIWNPRDKSGSSLEERVEARIGEIIPNLTRISSGAKFSTVDMERTLTGEGLFHRPVHMDAPHDVRMTRERYLGAWRSVNDIQVQAGPKRMRKILKAIEEEISDRDEIVLRYRSRAWTVQAIVRKQQ